MLRNYLIKNFLLYAHFLGGNMLELKWFDCEVPSNLQTRQVYGVIFTEDGRTLLKVETRSNGKISYSLAGGTPESFDKDRIATLRRELVEEVNTTIKDDIYYVGYQQVSGDGDKPTYAQVRMTAMIDKIGEKLPDPDNGKTYDRLLTPPERAIELLGWGDIGKNIITNAVAIAKNKFGLKLTCNEDEYV